MKKMLYILTTVLLFSCSKKQYKEPHILISTDFGDIEAELYPNRAPKTVAAFLSYIDAGLYNNSTFYRVVKTEDLPEEYITGIIQGGVWKTNSGKKPAKGIEHESTAVTGLSHTNGILSLARTTPGSASSEFFICIGDQKQFDADNSRMQDSLGFAAFGKVITGMDAVRNIMNQKNTGDAFIKAVKIEKIEHL